VIETASNVAGFIGMACIIFAYWYQTSRTAPDPFVQHGVNLIGAVLLTLSLLVNMNPASFVLEFFWAAIAIWGLWKALRAQKSPSRSREGLGVGTSGNTGPASGPPPAPLPQAGVGE
jgi:phosphoglycerol transferase MdoB-like AlkP superfamily enzyme